MVSRVRKKFALVKYSLDAAGVPAFGGNVQEPDRHSVGRFANPFGSTGSLRVGPVRHNPGAPLGSPFAAGASAEPPARLGSGTQKSPVMHSAFGLPASASEFSALQNERFPCFGASVATMAIPAA